MKSSTLNKPLREKAKRRVNVALGAKHHRKLRGFARRNNCNLQQAAERAVELLTDLEPSADPAA